jgi:uncharacterized protein (TIGR02996 family)
MSTRAALEAALEANPEDLAGWHALADLLIEEGDPRGDFMRVQIALEDSEASIEDRHQLKQQEDKIFEANSEHILGPHLAKPDQTKPNYLAMPVTVRSCRRGWLWNLDLHHLDDRLLEALQQTSETRYVQALSISEFDYQSSVDASSLASLEFISRLRSFSLGEHEEYTHTHAREFGRLVRKLSRIENLTLNAHHIPVGEIVAAHLPHLKTLSLNCTHGYDTEAFRTNASLAKLESIHFLPHMMDDPEPYLRIQQLRDIVESPHLTSLKRLTLIASDLGNEGCALLVSSGLLFRLTHLNLSSGTITDEGADILIEALTNNPHQLVGLNLSYNAINPVDRLTALAARSRSLVVAHVGQRLQPVPDFEVGDME